MKVNSGDLIYIVTLRDGMGRPRAWKLSEVVAIEKESNTVVCSYYRGNLNCTERTIKRVSPRDLEKFTANDLKIQARGYHSVMESRGAHDNGDWKLLVELGKM